MTAKLLHGSVWPAIREIAEKNSARTVAAVPYFGAGALLQLGLKEGDCLVVQFTEGAVKAGQIDPREVLKALREGIKVFSYSGLHAKVYVFGKTAVIGSANASSSSETLVEACVVTREAALVASARRFVRSIALQEVSEELARQWVKHIPQRRTVLGTASKKGSLEPIWLLPLEVIPRDEVDERHFEREEPVARKSMEHPRVGRLHDFCFSGALAKDFQVGQRVVQLVKYTAKKIMVEPPGTIVRVVRYKVGRQHRAIVFLEILRGRRARQWEAFQKSLKIQDAALAARIDRHRERLLKRDELIRAVELVWR